jgi:hypothetical protein
MTLTLLDFQLCCEVVALWFEIDLAPTADITLR